MNRPAASDSARLLGRIAALWLAYIRGHLIMALVIGALTWLVGSAIGLPGALWLGVLAGALEPIPQFGPLVASVPAIIVALWQGSNALPVANWVFAIIVLGSYVLIQQITSLLLEPNIVGKQLDLPPLVVLMAVILGGVIASVPGTLLAVPVLVTLRELFFYVRRKAQGLPPFPEDETPSD